MPSSNYLRLVNCLCNFKSLEKWLISLMWLTRPYQLCKHSFVWRSSFLFVLVKDETYVIQIKFRRGASKEEFTFSGVYRLLKYPHWIQMTEGDNESVWCDMFTGEMLQRQSTSLSNHITGQFSTHSLPPRHRGQCFLPGLMTLTWNDSCVQRLSSEDVGEIGKYAWIHRFCVDCFANIISVLLV